MLGLALPWLVIIAIFVVATIFHVINNDKLLKDKYQKKH